MKIGKVIDMHGESEAPDTEHFISASKLFSMKIQPMHWAIRGLVEQAGFVILGGEPKTSKSWVALEWAISFSSGTEAFGDLNFTTPNVEGPVALFMMEDGISNIQARVSALSRSKGLDPSKLPMNYRFRQSLNLSDSGHVDWCIKSLGSIMSKSEPGLVIFDPLRNIHTEDENDSKAMTKVTDSVRKIRDATGASIVITHHLRKPTKGDAMSPGHAIRGTGALYGACDGLVCMFADHSNKIPDSWINTVYTRCKAGKEADPFNLTLEVKDGHHGRAHTAKWEVSNVQF
jgi:RecA-family ATPase